MSASWHAATVIGIKVPKDKVIREETYFCNKCICKPQIDPEIYPEAKFCPACGGYIKRKCIRNVVLFDGLIPWRKEGSSICGWSVYAGTDGRFFYIGIFIAESEGDYDKKSPLPNISKDEMIKFRRDMEKAGLWDQKAFGMWTILYCSY